MRSADRGRRPGPPGAQREDLPAPHGHSARAGSLGRLNAPTSILCCRWLPQRQRRASPHPPRAARGPPPRPRRDSPPDGRCQCRFSRGIPAFSLHERRAHGVARTPPLTRGGDPAPPHRLDVGFGLFAARGAHQLGRLDRGHYSHGALLGAPFSAPHEAWSTIILDSWDQHCHALVGCHSWRSCPFASHVGAGASAIATYTAASDAPAASDAEPAHDGGPGALRDAPQYQPGHTGCEHGDRLCPRARAYGPPPRRGTQVRQQLRDLAAGQYEWPLDAIRARGHSPPPLAGPLTFREFLEAGFSGSSYSVVLASVARR